MWEGVVEEENKGRKGGGCVRGRRVVCNFFFNDTATTEIYTE